MLKGMPDQCCKSNISALLNRPAFHVAWMLLFAMPEIAFAHIDVNWPPMRGGSQKVGPCEGVSPLVGNQVVLRSGSQLTLRVAETIPHPGHFRVMFDADATDGEDFPVPADCDDVRVPDGVRVLADGILPAQGGTCSGFHTPSTRTPRVAEHAVVVTLPDIECDTCTLQVVQVMTDAAKARPDGTWDPSGGRGLYFRCANIRLSRTETPDVDPGGAAPNPGVHPPDHDHGAGAPAVTSDAAAYGGCRAFGGAPLSATWMLALGLLWHHRIRRGRRRCAVDSLARAAP